MTELPISANPWTDFYMIGTSVVKELRIELFNVNIKNTNLIIILVAIIFWFTELVTKLLLLSLIDLQC